MSKAAEPKKLKVYVTKLRELIPSSPSSSSIDNHDDEENAKKSLYKSYKLLLLTELAQRGVVYPNLLPDSSSKSSSDDIKEEEEKILNAIQNLAGRSLIDKQQQPTIPTPLVSGCAAVCAMMAETCADYSDLLQTHENDDEESGGLLNAKSDGYQLALDRCKEVQDHRFYSLLQLSYSSTNNFLKMSYGQYLRAANFGKIDTPPLWKKSLDVALKYSSSSSSSSSSAEKKENDEYQVYQHAYVITPLLHLIDIASQRNNAKRVWELSLYLILGYLSLLENDYFLASKSDAAAASSSSASRKRETKTLEEITEQSFITQHDESTLFLPSKQKQPSEITIKQLVVEKAQEIASSLPSTSSFDEDNVDSNLILLQTVLQLKLNVQHEKLQIEELALEEYEKAKHRLNTESDSKKPAKKQAFSTSKKKETVKSMEEYRKEAAYTLCLERVQNQYDDALEESAMKLVELIQSSWGNTAASNVASAKGEVSHSTYLEKMAINLITYYLQRFITTSRALSLSKKQKNTSEKIKLQWKKLLSVIAPFLQTCKEKIKINNNAEDNDGTTSLPCIIMTNKNQQIINLAKEDETAVPYLTTCLSNNERILIDTMASFVMMYYWMMEGFSHDNNVSDEIYNPLEKCKGTGMALQYEDMLLTSYLILSGFKVIRMQNEKDSKNKDGGVIGKAEQDEQSLQEKQAVMQSVYALVACKYRIGLILLSSSTTTDMENEDELEQGKSFLREFIQKQQQNEEDIYEKMHKKTKTTSTNTKQLEEKKMREYITSIMGIQYLHFVASWSGLHSSPWLYSSSSVAQKLRLIVQRAQHNLALSNQLQGRKKENKMEDYMIQMGTADVESCTISNGGGFANVGVKGYQSILSLLEEEESFIGEDNGQEVSKESVTALLKSHCLLGLSKITMFSPSSVNNNNNKCTAEEYARQSLETIQSISSLPTNNRNNNSFYLYRNPQSSFTSAIKFHLSTSRLYVAESLLRFSANPQDACVFLNDAVKDSPKDYDVIFVLGVFKLRMYLYYSSTEENNKEKEAKEAQMQLLRAAKLNTKKADPFALLGLWYEIKGDIKRANGCFVKALALDASHPVAGRGILRLKKTNIMDESMKKLCQAAIKTTTTGGGGACGWAYAALGRDMAFVDGNDEDAIVYLQKALRCNDVENPQNEFLGVFFSDPTNSNEGGNNYREECGNVWSDLANCYCRLGKYSAAVRAYRSLHEVIGEENVRPDVLCAWAQVELDLGLYDEAVSKFENVLATTTTTSSSSSHLIAAYGQGTAMLAIARRDVGEGKFGMALAHLRRGIDSIEGGLLLPQNETCDFSCALKLLGDIYSFGASLPPDVFENGSNSQTEDGTTSITEASRAQIAFVSKGEEAYRRTVEMLKEKFDAEQANEEIDNDHELVTATAMYDVGANLLWQARLLCASLGEGTGGRTDTTTMKLAKKHAEVKNMFCRSIDAFLQSIDASPSFATAWCGLGCALMATDPLLAQHSFCRALQLDKSQPDAWANLGLLCAEYGNSAAAIEAMDALTQVADSPLMWIGRGMLLENKYLSTGASNEIDARIAEASLCKAADAYRAALQVAQHPFALFGLALTSRRLGLQESTVRQDHDYCNAADWGAKVESRASMSIYLQATGGQNIGAKVLGDVMKVEEISEHPMLNEKDQRDVEDHVKEILTKLNHFSIDISDGTVSHGDGSLKNNKITDRSSLALSDPNELVKVIAEVTQSKERLGDNSETLEPLEERGGLNMARNLVHENPDRGDLWLCFAKELAKELVEEDCSTKESRKAFETALDATISAASKAYSLMHDQVVNVRLLVPRRQVEGTASGSVSQQEHHDFSHKPVVPEVVEASMVSECMALISWLNEMQKDDDTEETSPVSTSIELQRALLLDPENSLARAGLEK